MSSHATIKAAVAELYRELPAAARESQYAVRYYDPLRGVYHLAGPFDRADAADKAAVELIRDGYTLSRVFRLV